MSPRILLISQMRLESTRFPRKALALLHGQPLALWHLARLAQVTTPETTIVVAIPDTPANHELHALCLRHGYRAALVPGDPQDVLGRFAKVAAIYRPEHIVRVCGDCPLIDPRVIDQVIASHLRGTFAVTGTAREWGDGLDLEVMTMHALEVAQATVPPFPHARPSLREHVSMWLHQSPSEFPGQTYPCPWDLSWLRLSVDTQEDRDLLERILQRALQTGYGVDLGWRTLASLCQAEVFRDRMKGKAINQALVEQVARETGQPAQSWEQLRYGGHA